MAEAVGLSVASASIAAVQLVSRLQSIASAFFKSVIASQDFKVLQTRYDRELGRLSVILQVLRPEDPNSPSIPMHVFEELYLELRKQAVALELFQNAKLGSASTLAAKVSLFRWTLKDKHRIEEFIALVERYSDILERMVQLNTPMLMRSQKLTLQPENLVPSAESSLGLKVVSTPENVDSDSAVDIIFIHGLQARSLATWSGVRVFWPRDLLKDEFPNARILTFDYNLGPSSLLTKGRVLLEAKTLIRDIERLSQDTSSQRPLVFCAHSFGGLLLKSAMTYCQRAQSFDESCEGILARTKGALFFGVPSPVGRSTSWFSEYLKNILGSEYGIDQSISIDLATKFSGEFGELFRADSDAFRDLSRSHGWLTFSFYESKAAVTRSGHVFITALGDIHPAEDVGVLPGDHYTMCRFQTNLDAGFSIVSRRLKLIIYGEQIPSNHFDTIKVKKTKGKMSDILESSQSYNKSFDRYIKQISDQLGPQNIVPLGHGQTATWLNKNDKFQSWIRGDTKRLTICGPAGIGKTHLVSNIVSQLKPKIGLQNRMQEREALVHVVDWKDKDRLDPTSVLLSFLFQLLKSNADLFKQIYNRMHDPPVIYEDLEHLLVDLLSNSRLKHLELIVHGIDNMDQSSRDQVGNTLSRLVSAKRGMPNAKVLLTCRSCGIFSDEVEASFSNLDLGPSERFRLSLEEVARTGESSVEFTAYVKQCITAMPNSHKLPTELRDLIEERLLRKTVGVQEIQGIWKYNALQPNSLRNNFLWISLVADLIGSEQSPSNVKKVLKVATDQLNDLDLVYTQLIERTPPDVEIVQILTFIKCARRPMSLQELTFAIAIHSQHHSAQEVVEDQFFSLDTILESYASALVLFQNDTVSLVHSSLSDYLERHSPDSMDFSHQELAKACMWSLFLGARTQGVQLSPNAQEETFFNTSTHPFMRYASEFWFEHVRLALPYDFDGLVFNLTMRFVNSDSWTRWKFWYCKLRGKGTYPSNASPVHIFAALGLLGHAKAVKSLWSDINQKDESGKSVIYYAAANNAQGTIDFILDKCGNALLLDATDQELLYLAVTKTNLRLLKKILEQPNLELPHSLLIAAIDGRHWSALGLLKRYLEDSRSREQVLQYWVTVSDDNGGALHHAVLSRNLSLVESFLDEGGKPNDSTGGKTPLHLAAQIGDELITEELIAAGGLVDIKDESHNNTPLHYATEAGSLKVVQLLLEHGADITSLNSKKQTSLHVAARCGHEDIVLLLLASGAEVNGKDEDGTTPLHLASAGSWDPIVRRLLDQGGDACATSYNKRTPLHLAAANGSREIAGMLLAAGAPVNAKDHNDQTPLHAAVQRGSVDLVLMLIERGADPSAVDESGKSPLHYAVAADSASAKIVQLLMETGADADLRDGAQKTALDFAAAEGNNIIAALLCAPRRKPDEDLKSWVAVEPMEYQVTVFEKNLSISKTTD